jgi:hypothetical protein
LWPEGEAVLTEAEAQKTLGGDRYVTSLREAIDAALAALRGPSASEDVTPPISSSESAVRPNT